MSKNFLWTFIVTFCLVINFHYLKAQNPTADLLIGSPGISEKIVPDVQQQLESMNGVQYFGFTPKDDLFRLRYDVTVYTDGPKQIILNLEEAFPQLQFYLKEKGPPVINGLDGSSK